MSVSTAVIPFNFDRALPPFHLILPNLNLFHPSITRNRDTHTTTTSSRGSAPYKSKPLKDQYNNPHNQAIISIWDVFANLLNFRNNSASCDNSISREMTRPTLKVRTKLPASHHHSREESLHANSRATSVQAITREVVAFTVACITYNGSRPSLRTARPPISLTSNAESSTTP